MLDLFVTSFRLIHTSVAEVVFSGVKYIFKLLLNGLCLKIDQLGLLWTLWSRAALFGRGMEVISTF